VFTPEEWKRRAWLTFVIDAETAEHLDPLSDFGLELERLLLSVLGGEEIADGSYLTIHWEDEKALK
jgi:hypothetical protein